MTLQFFSVMRDPTLASVPFFLFMGYLLEQSGLMERLFRGVQLVLAAVRGSLYLAVLVTATIFAAATGIVGSSVTLLGVMAAPAMKRSGYDMRMSAGAITAGGTLGILIPPSVMLIVMGPVVGVPATDLFAAAVIPGLAAGAALHRLRAGAQLPRPLARARRCRWKSAPSRSARSCGSSSLGIAPVVVVILATLGVILAGIATPTDAGAVGAFAVLLMTLVYRRMTWAKFKSRRLCRRCDVLHDPAAGGGVELLRRGLLAAGQRDPDRRVAADPRPAADRHAAPDPGDHLRAGLAAGMGADRADRRADPAAAGATSSASTWCGSARWSRCACRRRGFRRRWRCRPTSSRASCRTGS